MIVREALIWITFIGILCTARCDQTERDRWSRQITNSEWIPLTNPRNSQIQQQQQQQSAPAAASAVDSSPQAAGQVPAVALPPALQQQYQDQLLQLQKTQESIQRLLQLQQQLKAQQQILQSQAYQPNAFGSSEEEKQALHQTTIVNLQTLPQLAPEVLVPPVPSGEALPPVFQPQDFLATDADLKRTRGGHHGSQRDYRPESITRPTSRPRDDSKDYRIQQKTRFESTHKHKEEPSHVNFVTPPTSSAVDEEIQLVYVPAETLAQRGKLQRAQNRKLPSKYHQHHSESSSTPLTPHDAYAREILQQLQRQHDEKNQFLTVEREKEIARLHAEQLELEKQARLHQETVRKEQELMRQREAEKKRKELEKIEEASRQRELQRIRDIRERERKEERRLSELKIKQEEERRRELERFSNYQKDQVNEEVANQQLAGVQSQNYEIEQPHAQAFVHNSPFHQHLTEVTSKNVKNTKPRNKPRNKLNQYQDDQQDYRQPTETQTLPPPNQPPLSVFMGDSFSDHNRIRLTDVLKTLKSARTIAVLDNFGPETPRVFVGPRHLEPPPGYAKFELPYLSSIENNRVERKVDKLPFFVAPLSFEPPPGYSKIPFPAPHIGSVVINTLENVEVKSHVNQSPNLNPLIEPNAYQVVSNSPSPTYDVSTTASYAPEPITPRYEVSSSLPPSQSTTKWRFQEFYENKPSTEKLQTVTATTYQDERTSTSKLERPTKTRNYYSQNEVSTTPNYYSPKTISAFSYESIPQSTPVYNQEHNADTHFVNQNANHHRPHFPDPVPAIQRYPVDPTGHTVTNTYFLNQSPNYEEQTQYNLPAELPAISPQLPGLVNALVEKTELSSSIQTPTTPPTTTTTTTTTTETPTTTYRPRTRLRGRVTSSRATTLSPPTRTTADRTRRPINRSRSKYTTTTEDYHDSSYDPTKRTPVTSSRYDDNDMRSLRRPTVRNHNYKPREEETKESIQSQVVDSNEPSEQGQQEHSTAYENVSQIDAASSTASAAAAAAPLNNQRISDSLLPLAGLEYSRKTNLASSDEAPINGFDYRTHEISPSPLHNKDFGGYHRPGKTESVVFQPIAGTDGPNVQRSHLQDFSPVYHPVPIQGNFGKADTPRPVYNNDEEQPVFLPIPQDKPDDYAYVTVPTTTTIPTTTSTTTTTEAPVIIRQRVRGRLSGRPSQQADSAIQTRPRGSHDEYVRFSAVNQDASNKPTTSRPRSRQRTRTQHQQNSPIQTNGGEYVRFQAAARRPTTTTASPPTTKPTEERPSADEEDSYGFIRTPNYNVVQQTETTHYQNVETIEPPSTTETSQSQAQLLKSRQKLYSATRRPSSSRITTTPHSDDVYTVRSRVRGSQSDEAKPIKARTRSRRPGSRRRTTTTTESSVDANNELPIDENYPRQENARGGRPDIMDENYPQEFVLNYGASQSYHRDEYEPSQVANDAPRRQQHSSSRRPSGDIYGAESQWSTKLSGNSFQPSSYTPNQANDNSDKSVEAEAGDKAGDLPEIITAGPDVPSITVLVSSDSDNNEDTSTEQQQPSSSEESAGKMMQTMIDFGKKMNADEEADNVTTTPAAPTHSSTENLPTQEFNKPSSATFKKAGLRRRRVRVRVRPAGTSSEDFVTAESQSYDSSLNNLPREPPKFRNFYLTTVPTTSASATTATTTTTMETPQTEKSAFEAFLDKMLGDNKDRLTTSEPEVITTTIDPDDSWMIMPTITPSDEIREESTTTVRQTEEDNTEVPTTPSWTTTIEAQKSTSGNTMMATMTTTPKFEEIKSNSGENVIQSLNQENSLRYFVTKSPAFNEYLRSQEQAKAVEGNAEYPKNHRSKWSEVRYPSDKSLFGKWVPKNQTEEKQQQQQQQQQTEENDSSVTDYVKAIFESIKSADEEHHQKAKLTEQHSPSTTNSRQDKELFKAESTSFIPTEVKTSVSSSSRVVFQPLASNDNLTTSTTESATFGPFVPSMMSDKQIGPVKKSSFETNLGKILRTSTTTKVSHMTEICYRGRCVMSKPKKDGVSR
ncbi:mucin-2 [Phymastichus coffea]|uniref:mucin-2 n=1 Tax=Phymastichus coffea TaxID=108790 RepID=UPI00273C787F|nr:mucin-2 [Phymastichus coffea]